MTISTPSGWGRPFAENPEPGGPSLPLVTLFEVLQRRPASVSLQTAIKQLGEKLGEHDGLRLYGLRPGRDAEPVTDVTVWPAIYPPPVRRTLSAGLSRRTPIPHEASPVWPEHRGVTGVLERLRLWQPNATDTDQMAQTTAFQTAILASDALELFGYGKSTSPAPAHVVPLHLVEQPARAATLPAAPAAEVVNGDDGATAENDLPAKRRQAVARLRELGDTKGCRKKVADEFGIAERTVGKWIAVVEKEDAEARKAAAQSAQDLQLTCA